MFGTLLILVIMTIIETGNKIKRVRERIRDQGHPVGREANPFSSGTSWPLCNISGVGASTSHSAENPHVTFDTPKLDDYFLFY